MIYPVARPKLTQPLVIIVDNLSNSYESVLHSITTLVQDHCEINAVPQPLLHFHRLDYRSRAMALLLERYSDLVMTIDSDGNQHMTYHSRISGVIHFAAYKSVFDSIKHPLHYYQNNVCGLVSLLQRLEAHGIHNFIFSSSATVYGTKANAGVPLHEEDLSHSVSSTSSSLPILSCPYARTKYFSEAILADAATSNPAWRIVALRYFNPVGCDPSGLLGENPCGEATNLYPVLAQVLTGARSGLDIFGRDWKTRDGTAIRDFVHVLDVARGHIAALRWNMAQHHTHPHQHGHEHEHENGLDGADGGIGETKHGRFRAFNLGSGTGTTVLEAVHSLEQAANRPVPVRWADRRPGDVGACVASTDRARKELGWVPRESIAQCAVDLWNFVRRSVR
jgi:UDP-glucose 4-epimerase